MNYTYPLDELATYNYDQLQQYTHDYIWDLMGKYEGTKQLSLDEYLYEYYEMLSEEEKQYINGILNLFSEL